MFLVAVALALASIAGCGVHLSPAEQSVLTTTAQGIMVAADDADTAIDTAATLGAPIPAADKTAADAARATIDKLVPTYISQIRSGMITTGTLLGDILAAEATIAEVVARNPNLKLKPNTVAMLAAARK